MCTLPESIFQACAIEQQATLESVDSLKFLDPLAAIDDKLEDYIIEPSDDIDSKNKEFNYIFIIVSFSVVSNLNITS